MQQVSYVFVLALSLLTVKSFAADVGIDVKLSPAGSFTAKTSKVNGVAYKTADGVEANDITIDLKSIETGISLRDKHTKERLMVDKFPTAKLLSATGKNGKGKAVFEIKGKKQTVEGTYKEEGGMLKAQFKVHLPELDIKDVRYMGVGVKDDVMVNINVPIQAGRMPASKNK